MSPDAAISSLHATLVRRDTPETVAQLIDRALPPELRRRLQGPIHDRIAASVRRMFGWSSMRTVFQAPAKHADRFAKVRELALLFLQARLPEGDDPDELEQLLSEFNALTGKRAGAASFKEDTGFTSQQERKARWLRTTTCRSCFIAGRKAEQAEAAQRDGAVIAHLDLPALVGSDRQIGWATTIRAGRLAALVAAPLIGNADALRRCVAITEAKWWIDHRDLSDADLVVGASQAFGIVQRPDHGHKFDIRSRAA